LVGSYIERYLTGTVKNEKTSCKGVCSL
jgi:hypothetical protein